MLRENYGIFTVNTIILDGRIDERFQQSDSVETAKKCNKYYRGV